MPTLIKEDVKNNNNRSTPKREDYHKRDDSKRVPIRDSYNRHEDTGNGTTKHDK